MMKAHDRIAILIIDDRPEGLYQIHDDPVLNYPDVPPELSHLFEVGWIASPGEGRQYRDICRSISHRNPRTLGQLHVVPEIIVADYALLDDRRSVRQRFPARPEIVERVSPLSALKRVAVSLGIEVSESQEWPGSIDDRDTTGCFLGGLLLATFADHPSCAISLSAWTQDQLEHKHAGYFEWLLEEDSQGALLADGRFEGGWQVVFDRMLPRLRKRIEKLIAGRVVVPSLYDLLALATDKEHSIVTLDSKYCRKQYPVDGLFGDIPVKDRRNEVRDWASRIVTSITSHWKAGHQVLEDGIGIGDLEFARALTDRLWDAWLDEEMTDGFLELSTRLAKGDPIDDRLGQLKSLYGVKSRGEGYVATNHCVDLRYPDYGKVLTQPLGRRWTVLFIVVKLLQCRWIATRRYREAANARDNSEKAWDSDNWSSAFQILPFSEIGLTADDVYFALFPRPADPLPLPWHADKKDIEGSSWGRVLERLPQRLKLKHLLEGLDWNPETSEYGITTAERFLMQTYAEAIGFGRDKWQHDGAARLIMLGRDAEEN